MHYRELYISTHLQATEFNGRVPTFTIARIEVSQLPSLRVEGAEETKGVIFFREITRGWVMNRTNVECLKEMFGKETNDWLGKRVTLRAEDVQVGKRKDMGIRIVGSPDLAQEVSFELALPMKKPRRVRLVKTTPNGQRIEEPAAAAPGPRGDAGVDG
jgi:hypothetical protein